jgi:hypothetical protein
MYAAPAARQHIDSFGSSFISLAQRSRRFAVIAPNKDSRHQDDQNE